jgi:hypothetical protein
MGAGGQNRGAHQREWAIARAVTPVSPRLVRGSLADAEDTLVVGAPNTSTHNNDGYNACPLKEWSSFHGFQLGGSPLIIRTIDTRHFTAGSARPA